MLNCRLSLRGYYEKKIIYNIEILDFMVHFLNSTHLEPLNLELFSFVMLHIKLATTTSDYVFKRVKACARANEYSHEMLRNFAVAV